MSAPDLRTASNGTIYIHWTDGRRSKRISTRQKDMAEAKMVLGLFLLERAEKTRLQRIKDEEEYAKLLASKKVRLIRKPRRKDLSRGSSSTLEEPKQAERDLGLMTPMIPDQEAMPAASPTDAPSHGINLEPERPLVLLTEAEVAERLQCSVPTLARLRAKRLIAFIPGRPVMYFEADVAEIERVRANRAAKAPNPLDSDLDSDRAIKRRIKWNALRRRGLL